MNDVSQKTGVDNSQSPLQCLLILLPTSTGGNHSLTRSLTDSQSKPLADEVSGVSGEVPSVRHACEVNHILHQLPLSPAVVGQCDRLQMETGSHDSHMIVM